MTVSLEQRPLEVALLATRMSVLGHDPCGGSEVIFWEDWRILRQARIPVRAYGRAASNGAPVTILPSRTGVPLVSSLDYCGRFLLKERQAVLVAYNEPTIAGLAPDRSIIRFDWSTPLPRYWKLPGWLQRFQRALYLFPSEDERRLFLRLHPLMPEKSTAVIPNAVDLNLFRPTNSKERSPRVGFAGQWAPRKGVSTLLEAWDLVRNWLPAAELWLAGGPELWKGVRATPGANEIAEQVKRSVERGVVRLAGEYKRSEMPSFWNSVTVAVVPSSSESFGLVALEALACGVPVVASAVGGLTEIVVDGECGLRVPPDAPDQLAKALVALLSNEPLRQRLAEGARRRAKAFALEQRAKSLLTLLEGRGTVTALRSRGLWES